MPPWIFSCALLLLILILDPTWASRIAVPDVEYEIIRLIQNEDVEELLVYGCHRFPHYFLLSANDTGVQMTWLPCESMANEGSLQLPTGLSKRRMLLLDVWGCYRDHRQCSSGDILIAEQLSAVTGIGYFVTVDWQDREVSIKNASSLQIYASQKPPPNSAVATFSEIYHRSSWTKAGGGSGPGSTIERTAVIRKHLAQVIQNYSITSMTDAPCGAMVWMPSVLEKFPNVRYTGLDVACPVITKLRERPKLQRLRFYCADMCAQGLFHHQDLIFTRDALMHLPHAMVFKFLENVKRSGAKYLMVTSFHRTVNNQDIRMGNWSPLNLQAPPFRLRTPVASFDENFDNKVMLLYDVSAMEWDDPVTLAP